MPDSRRAGDRLPFLLIGAIVPAERGSLPPHLPHLPYDRRMDKTFTFIGALMGLLGVGIGAFGAHGLRGRLAPDMLAVFETGVRYHMYHALAILATAALVARVDGRALIAAGWCFTAGILVFSGSLYALALSGVTVLGAITPIGGVAFLLGWGCLLVAAL
jgi:uncharacterized membrane protein YgdD (TMEM256/DUF423 family)